MQNDITTVHGVPMSTAAAFQVRAYGLNAAEDVRRMRDGEITMEGLLADCFAIHARQGDAWSDYVGAVVAAADNASEAPTCTVSKARKLPSAKEEFEISFSFRGFGVVVDGLVKLGLDDQGNWVTQGEPDQWMSFDARRQLSVLETFEFREALAVIEDAAAAMISAATTAKE